MFHFDRYDEDPEAAADETIRELTQSERVELRRFCQEWLSVPVPRKHSGWIRMVGLGKFRMSLTNLCRILVAFDARTKWRPPEY